MSTGFLHGSLSVCVFFVSFDRINLWYCNTNLFLYYYKFVLVLLLVQKRKKQKGKEKKKCSHN